MSSEWIESSIGNICRNVFSGGTPKSTVPEYFDGGIPWLKTKEVNYCKITTTENSITDAGLKNSSAKLVPVNSVIVAMYGNGDTAGRVAINKIELTTNQACCNLVVDGNRADYRFVYYYLKSQYAKLVDLKNGGAQQNLNAKLIKDYPIIVPPLFEQAAIGGFLEALDDRIALLRETNATLEAIAQTLFKSWFVDFDPVRAKQQGRPPESLDPATAALFPDDFEDTELGPVPKGWRVAALPEVFDFKEGPGIRNWQYTNSDEGTRFINIRCIQDGDLDLDTANRITDEEANGKYAHFHLQPWDIVVSTSGTLGRSAIVRQEHLPLVLNTSVIRFRPISEISTFSFVYEYLISSEFLFKLESMASGSVQKNFGPMHLKQIKMVCPPFQIMSQLEKIARPLFEKIVANRAQAQTLATLRDTLLPRLISGQLRLPEAEALLEQKSA